MMVNEQSVIAYVGIGSNLDEPEAQVRLGMRALGSLPQTTVTVCSSVYRSTPVGVTGQPDFVNAVCRLETRLDAGALLAALLELEAAHGRTREIPHGPRILDLDMLLYGEETFQSPTLTVPHPRVHERAFVLYPLEEIAPDLNVPGLGPVAQLAAACADQQIEKLGPW